MRILACPRDDSNPYQRLLYDEMRRLGVRVGYLGCLTPSHTLNLVLLPPELAFRRLTGYRVVHVHWVHGFAMTGSERFRTLRRVAQAYFCACLWFMRILGFRIVWTAHNVLPHEQVFADDFGARRRLVNVCDLVLAHSPSALAELSAHGLAPRRTSVIPHGQIAPSLPAEMLRTPGSGEGPRQLIFCGRIRDYKGIDDLLDAFELLPDDVPAQLAIVGECDDPQLRSALLASAARSGDRVRLRLERVSDEEVSLLLADADGVILPFRRATTSGSAILGLCHGRPLIAPAMPAFADLPDAAVVRYDGTTQGLADAMAWITRADAHTLAAMSAAARRYASALTWPDIAATTIREMKSVLAGTSHTSESATNNLHAAR